MEETKKKRNINKEDSRKKKKERHIVTWNQEEDAILREQITLRGTENWAIIASKFKDKSTRQCRRRWFTYLNSDFKRGGWSPEEDKLLCEAQSIFGNRWTEIAKVVSGRTDNAVKNRFTTLCKKRAKNEAMAKENNSNNKRKFLDRTRNVKEDEEEEMFLKKDDSKVMALMKQAELLSSLAQKVSADNTEQSMENAWKVLQEFLNKGKENDLLRYGIPDLHDSPDSSEYSSGSNIMLGQSCDRTQPLLSDIQTEHKQGGEELNSTWDVLKNPNENVFISAEESFCSPIKVTPLFRSLADGIPSPQFSESERRFLLKTLGIESSSPCLSVNPSQPPPCKRVLLHSL